MNDFAALWSCISKIWRTTHLATYMREIVLLKYSYGCYKGEGVFAMFILVSISLVFVTGGLSGSPWRMFEFWSGLTKCLLYIVH